LEIPINTKNCRNALEIHRNTIEIVENALEIPRNTIEIAEMF
jgi:hypothetical protein